MMSGLLVPEAEVYVLGPGPDTRHFGGGLGPAAAHGCPSPHAARQRATRSAKDVRVDLPMLPAVHTRATEQDRFKEALTRLRCGTLDCGIMKGMCGYQDDHCCRRRLHESLDCV